MIKWIYSKGAKLMTSHLACKIAGIEMSHLYYRRWEHIGEVVVVASMIMIMHMTTSKYLFKAIHMKGWQGRFNGKRIIITYRMIKTLGGVKIAS